MGTEALFAFFLPSSRLASCTDVFLETDDNCYQPAGVLIHGTGHFQLGYEEYCFTGVLKAGVVVLLNDY